MSGDAGTVGIGLIRAWREPEPDGGIRVRITTYPEGMQVGATNHVATTVDEALEVLGRWLRDSTGNADGDPRPTL